MHHLCRGGGGYWLAVSGTPVVDVRVGAYLLLLFVLVAGITEMPMSESSRKWCNGELQVENCQNYSKESYGLEDKKISMFLD